MTQKTNITMEERRATAAATTVAADRKRTGAVVTVERNKVKRRSNFETLIKFGTDASGLERTFRLLQALAQCIQHIRSIRSIFIFLLYTLPQLIYTFLFYSSSPADLFDDLPTSDPTKQQRWYSHSAYTERQMEMTAIQVRGKLARGRRFFRIFRFLESFHSAWTLYYQSSTDNKDLATWLDISSKSFNGMYLLFETLGFFYTLGVTALVPWGRETSELLNVEGQRFWLFALVCGVVGGVVRLWNDRDQFEVGRDTADEKEKEMDEREKGTEEDEHEHEHEHEHGKQLKEEEHQRAVLEKKKEREMMRKDRRVRIIRRIVADLLDIAQPGAVVGWTPNWHGMIGVMMVGSTLLTGVEVWEKCARLSE